MTALPPVPPWAFDALFAVAFAIAGAYSLRERDWIWGAFFVFLGFLNTLQATGVEVPDGYSWFVLTAFVLAVLVHKIVTD